MSTYTIVQVQVAASHLTLFLILYFCFKPVRPDLPFFFTMIHYWCALQVSLWMRRRVGRTTTAAVSRQDSRECSWIKNQWSGGRRSLSTLEFITLITPEYKEPSRSFFKNNTSELGRCMYQASLYSVSRAQLDLPFEERVAASSAQTMRALMKCGGIMCRLHNAAWNM